MEKLDLLSAAAVAGTIVVACSIYTVFQKNVTTFTTIS